mgnify:CR=1 FL=1
MEDVSHRSKLSSAYVDVPRRHYDASVRFYSELLGKRATFDAQDPDYAAYGAPETGIELAVQAIGDDRPRLHLDIETDDIEAEVARLVDLGATVVERIQTWVTMRDPVGIIFCVIRVQDANRFQAEAKTWT